MTEFSTQDFLSPAPSLQSDARDLCESRDDLAKALLRLESAVVPEDVPTITQLSDGFQDFAVKVSLVGQVKAGKTALANALLGLSDLLPSDVNPWTSVVTSVHINRESPKGKKAIFKFFDAQDWDDLVSSSGRIVELAKKAKLDSRVDELTTQIEELKARTEQRLGHNFKFLLGNQHAFSAFNGDLIKRYVCLGEEDMYEEREGRFADLTKSADLYMDNAMFPYPITIADTPGVNDPFLVREAATLESLRSSNVFVVVLSAHQALSSVDLGLLRLLKSLHSDRLIVFINRIDELPEPHTQIEEIRNYVSGILRKQKISADVPIVFGSAAWGDAAIRGDYDNLPEDSVESLEKLTAWRAENLPKGARDDSNVNNLCDVSGISALREMIHRKAWEEVFQAEISATANHARRLVERSILHLSKLDSGPERVPDKKGIAKALQKLDAVKARLGDALSQFEASAADDLKMAMASAYTSFRTTEERTLIACLSKSGKLSEWAPDIEQLRFGLNAAYNSYAQDAQAFLRETNGQVVQAIGSAYRSALGATDGVRISPLPVPELPIPVSLMRTMSIDMRASNSLEWLRRKLDKSIYLDQFAATVNADARTVLTEASREGVHDYLGALRAQFDAMIDSHRETISAFAKTGEEALEARLGDMMGKDDDLAGRLSSLRDASDILHALEGAGTEAEETADGGKARLMEPAE